MLFNIIFTCIILATCNCILNKVCMYVCVYVCVYVCMCIFGKGSAYKQGGAYTGITKGTLKEGVNVNTQ